MAVEYVVAFALTLGLGTAFGAAIGPPIETYRSGMQAELLETRALIADLETMCLVTP